MLKNPKVSKIVGEIPKTQKKTLKRREDFTPPERPSGVINKAKWFAKQLASLVYQCKAKVLEFPSKKSETLK